MGMEMEMYSSMSSTEFQAAAERLFLGGVQNAESIKSALVPAGTANSAFPGDYGDGGIFKYRFRSSDGRRLVVKYHRADLSAAGGVGCHSYEHCTAQIQVGHKLLSIDPGRGIATWVGRPDNLTHIVIVDF